MKLIDIADFQWPEFKSVKLKEPQVLNEDELNFILRVLASISSEIQSNIKTFKEMQARYWFDADKDTKTGKQAFSKLNIIRTSLKREKVYNKRFSAIINKLKTQR